MFKSIIPKDPTNLINKKGNQTFCAFWLEVYSTSCEVLVLAKKIELESDQAFRSYYEFIRNKEMEERVECRRKIQSVHTV